MSEAVSDAAGRSGSKGEPSAPESAAGRSGSKGEPSAPESGSEARGGGDEAVSRKGVLLVFVGALLVRLAVVAWAASRIPPAADGAFYHTIASRIAEGFGYTWLWPDGAVTYAGHYPVGYPAMVGAAYWLAGPHPPAAMLLNAWIGALAAPAAYVLAGRAGDRRSAILAGALVALHPGLVAYTPAMMTEGVTAALVAVAAWSAASRIGRWRRVILTGAIVGVATLVRPQSLVLAPVLGWLAAREEQRPRTREGRSSRACDLGALAIGAIAAFAVAIAVCAPWSVRNCVRMKTCALVSYNGGWNLLIGADDASTGTWAEIKVPPECRTVYDEAEKDVCFGGAARRYIAEHPGTWLSLAPKKLAATFDYAGAGGWYLHAANGDAFPERAKITIGAVETVFERLTLILALIAGAREGLRVVVRRLRGGAPRGSRAQLVEAFAAVALAVLGVAFAVQVHAWIAYVALGVLLAASAGRGPNRRGGALVPACAAVLLSLAAIHAAFFGAGRYSLVAFPLVTAVGALVFARRPPASPLAEATSGTRRS